MLSGNLIRVTHRKDAIFPKFLKPTDPLLLELAERLLDIYRAAAQTRLADLEESLDEIESEGPMQLVQKGLAKILLDRCEFNTESNLNPEQVRERAFLLSAERKKQPDWSPEAASHREPILRQLAEEFAVEPPEIESALYADLKSEQRLIRFDDLTPERLLHRYNVGLVQALLCRSTRLECFFRRLPPARSRQLARAAKFHRLISVWQQPAADVIHLILDGPLSLFSQTQKYGLQLANFFPHVVHAEKWEMTAHLLWGPEKEPKVLALNQGSGLLSHVPDFGSYRPAELELFERSFAKHSQEWKLTAEPLPVAIGAEIWFPDYILEHLPSGGKIPLELLGFWRRIDLEKQHAKLMANVRGPFLLVVAEDRLVDEAKREALGDRIVSFKKTATADGVVKAAKTLLIGK